MKRDKKDPFSHVVSVADVAKDGTGPWKLMVNGYGVACFPLGEGAAHDPQAYAREVARVLRKALRS